MIILLTIFLILCILKFIKQEKATKITLEQYQSFLDYTNHIEMLYNELSTFKHDYENVFFTLSTYIDESKNEKLKEFYYTHILPFHDKTFRNSDIDFKLSALVNNRSFRN